MHATNYGSVQYWNDRYQKQGETTFDWVEQWAELRPVLNERVVIPLYKQFLEGGKAKFFKTMPDFSHIQSRLDDENNDDQ